jgi:hypothetical protein
MVTHSNDLGWGPNLRYGMVLLSHTIRTLFVAYLRGSEILATPQFPAESQWRVVAAILMRDAAQGYVG